MADPDLARLSHPRGKPPEPQRLDAVRLPYVLPSGRAELQSCSATKTSALPGGSIIPASERRADNPRPASAEMA